MLLISQRARRFSDRMKLIIADFSATYCGAIVGSQFIKELDANPTIEDAVNSLIKKIKG